MAVDYFLIDAPESVPDEFNAWVVAKNRHFSLFDEYMSAGSDRRSEISVIACAAKVEADRLEGIARRAWFALHRQNLDELNRELAERQRNENRE
ncbi:hypothetical protein QRO08_11435 [Paracidovorax citrulli]|uniref:Uncharacterized protein n=2 Tax=Paracidovorax citrulli TaxID=80869 RepID=A1TQL3_PARC0|nr:hypothetical protein [Paracidovorax citrulli]ABM33251.1 hypothetical protein Aave_2679 [Paracidovorax citrulli AAC00-1]MVT28940.1 hypothetical protein [Paracidovorax citrulli]UMT83201.1 hypothetical protein FRC75_07320 [Paracidovorax citrulli]WIY31514.1 hypothetical protein QRO09_07315 [Paracidovorax citrulli]WIY40792.1 hypothetical protein QRO10_07590 [Paracidovorax citrulli]